MPIEIQELHIRINVEEPQAGEERPENGREERERLVTEVVEKVMEVLSTKEER